MPRAVWNDAVIAESEDTVLMEGNHYFSPDDVASGYLRPSSQRTVCPWKGVASYYDVVVDGEEIAAAAWYYPDPSPAAAPIKGRIAFWKGVRVESDGADA